jgi:hypothetical protein
MKENDLKQCRQSGARPLRQQVWRIILIAALTMVVGMARFFLIDHTDRLGYVYRPIFPWAWIALMIACCVSFRSSRTLSIIGFVVGALAFLVFLLPPLAT